MLDFDAGKYAPYVWPAYGLTALMFAGMVWASLAHARRWKRRFEALSGAPDPAAGRSDTKA